MRTTALSFRRSGGHFGFPVSVGYAIMGSANSSAPRRCANTVNPRGLADWIGVD